MDDRVGSADGLDELSVARDAEIAADEANPSPLQLPALVEIASEPDNRMSGLDQPPAEPPAEETGGASYQCPHRTGQATKAMPPSDSPADVPSISDFVPGVRRPERRA